MPRSTCRVGELQPLVDAFAYRFDHQRSHQALGDLTPAAYLATISSDAPAFRRSWTRSAP